MHMGNSSGHKINMIRKYELPVLSELKRRAGKLKQGSRAEQASCTIERY